jgi:uncharacterized repeat protein (TIGR04138 family)
MQEASLDEILDQIVAKDARYHRDAYFFVKDALDHTQKLVTKNTQGRLRHVSGQELLAGIREYSLSQFGPMVITVFDEWGIRNCHDFGEIVFNMVENKLLAKTDQDSREDFKDGYDFEDAFRKPYLPQAKVTKRVKVEKPVA